MIHFLLLYFMFPKFMCSLSMHSDPKVSSSILPNVLDMIGNTPLVRLDKIAKSEGLECDLRTFITWHLYYIVTKLEP